MTQKMGHTKALRWYPVISPGDRSDLTALSDEQLVRLAGKGTEEVFGVLVSRCAPMIQQQALRLRRVSMDAEDLAQEGFVGLLSAVRTYREEGGASFRTYAAVCIRNRMLSAIRQISSDEAAASVYEDPEEEMDLSARINGGQADPAQLVVQREDVALLRRRLQETLTDLEYEVLMLFLGAYTYEEIAQRLHCTTKTVDNALQRVRRKLSSVSFAG